jgi:starch-binding outer membrane protein, SusD/RagB family
LIGQLEVFNDMRRNGFGSFAGQQNWQVIGITPNAGTTIPQRFLIPQTELNSNTNVPSPAGLFQRTDVFGGGA